jgi:AraC family transcriptional regulator of adaptative response/methylated-DNA-[protein]-cysteine methyltransferase
VEVNAMQTAMNPKKPAFESRREDRWQAVLQRDSAYDGAFVYAVGTTGIYCRPSCPARRPRPENVTFFSHPAAAERAGYRECRRCRPRAETTTQDDLVTRAMIWLNAHLDERVTLSRLAEALQVSPGHLQRTFTRIAGVSPRAYAAARRMESSKTLMRDGASVTTALHGAGFGSSSRFYAQARDALGMTPSSYRKGGDGMAIAYATAESPFGRVLIAATERGICALSIGDIDQDLEAALVAEYPRATIRRDEDALRSALDAVTEHLRDRAPLPPLAVDVPGTPFQRRVWQELRAIPAGERRSYGELAAAIGKPDAARAVASACAANRTAIVIPCHRVVRADGEPSGYRWGAERKRALLAAELAGQEWPIDASRKDS